MRRSIGSGLLAGFLLLTMAACTDSSEPEAQPTSPASSSEQAEGQSPGTDVTPTDSGDPADGDELTADEAQALIDDTIATLRAEAAVQIRSRTRNRSVFGGITWNASAKWATGQDAWTSIARSKLPLEHGKTVDGYKREIFVDGRRFVDWSPRNSGSEWLDITKFSRQTSDARTSQLSELEAMTATSARTVGKWTTVIGTVPNEVALSSFGLADSSQSMGVSERMNEGETRVFVQLSARAPVVLSMRGIDTSTPGAELPPTFLKDLRAAFY